MYLTKENKENIANAFSDYGMWSEQVDEINLPYALARRAAAILKIVENGIPHHLEEWAKEVMSDPRYTEAEYVRV
jgi:hypothetical protein